MKILSVIAAFSIVLLAGCSSTTDNSSIGPYNSSSPAKAFESVRVSDAFYMAKFETMNHEFARVMDSLFTLDTLGFTLTAGHDSVKWKGLLLWLPDTAAVTVSSDTALRHRPFEAVEKRKNFPVTGVTWFGALLYCNGKSILDTLGLCYDTASTALTFSGTQTGWRLPDTSEWVLAARAGRSADSSLFPTGPKISEWLANYMRGGALLSLTAAGTYPPNPDSLYDMAGNVWEWCRETYSAADTSRLLKGGSYADGPDCQQTSFVSHERAVASSPLIGFRIVRKK